VCMLVMRRRAPDLHRPFRTPAAWVVGLGAIVGCAYLFISLPRTTQLWFLGWNVVGLLLYFLFVARRQTVTG
jgi:basic amino acid/polyamine antiporter, APA family